MDPIAQLEEEKRWKEETELRELQETLMLDEQYFSSRDLSSKGRDVHPSSKQRKIVQTIASTLKFVSSSKKRQEIEQDDDSFCEIDLNAKPRVFVVSGPINKKEPGTHEFYR